MLNGSFVVGEDVDLEVTFYTDKEKTTPKDMTGASGVGRLGSTSDTPTTTIESSAMTLVDAVNGIVNFAFTGAQTLTLTPGLFDFQGEALDTGGKKGIAEGVYRAKAALPDIP